MASATSIAEVQQDYSLELLRTGATSEINAWAAEISAGFLTPSQVASAIGASLEAVDFVLPIERLYAGLFGRVADSGGLNAWVNALRSGTSYTQIVTDFVTSQEFANDYSTTPNATAYVTALYENILGRAPDAGGLANWTAVLATVNTANLVTVALGILNSVEAANDSTAAIEQYLANAGVTGSYSTSITGLPGPAGGGTSGNSSFTLTTGADHVNNFTTVFGDLSSFLFNGIGPTLNNGDVISNVTNLIITDEYGSGNDVIPAGATLSNIQNVSLTTAGNAGNAGAPFDVSGISGVQTLTVTSSGGLGIDFVKASATTTIVVKQSNNGSSAGVLSYGGSTVTLTDAGTGGGVTVGSNFTPGVNPTGAVLVTETGTNGIAVNGGTTVGVTSSGPGTVAIGVNFASAAPSEPTGAVTVDETGVTAGAVFIFGGTDATVTTTESNFIAAVGPPPVATVDASVVTIGAVAGNVTYAPSGNITVTATATAPWIHNFATGANSGSENDVNIIGGTNVVVTTNDGNVTVGADIFNGTTAIAGENATGTVMVTDTANGGTSGTNFTTTTAIGPTVPGAGAQVVVYSGVGSVTVAADGGLVQVGADKNFDPQTQIDSGHGLTGNNVVSPSGAVTVTDTATLDGSAPLVVDGIVDANPEPVDVIGSGITTVSVTTNAGGVQVGDNLVPGTEPSGDVAIVDTSTDLVGGHDPVTVFGGAAVTVTANNSTVTIGDGVAAHNPSGDVAVTVNGIETGSEYPNTITIKGGDNISVTTSGGTVAVGTDVAKGLTPVTGTVSVTDTLAGPNADAVTILGGTTVTVVAPATAGAINIGAAPALNNAGTAVGNLADDPTTGTVSVTNALVSGTSTVFGTGAVNVTTNGATAVAITGATNANVIDAQTGVGGVAVGTSNLSTVSLTSVSGAVVVTSNVLANLNISNTISGKALGVTVTDTTAKTALTATLSAAKAVTVTDASNTITSLTVDTSGTSADDLAIGLPVATALTFNNGATVTVDAAGTNLSSVQTITATGAGALKLGNLSGDVHLANVTATAATGGVSVEIDPGETNFAGGSGTDTVTLDALKATSADLTATINGGSGSSNTVILTAAASAYNPVLHPTNPISDLVTGFSILGFGNNATAASGATGIYDVTGFSSETIGKDTAGGAISLINLPTTDAVAFTAAPGQDVSLTPLGTGATIGLTVGVDGTAGTAGVDLTGNAVTIIGTADLATPTESVPVLNIISVGDGLSGSTNKAIITDDNSGLTTVSVAGDEPLTLSSLLTGATNEINAVTVTDTANVNIGGAGNAGLFFGDNTGTAPTLTISIIGGAGTLTATGIDFANSNDGETLTQVGGQTETVTAGTGNLAYTFGFGGGGNISSFGTVTAGVGGETVRLGTETKASVLTSPDASEFGGATLGGVNPTVVSFHVTTSQATSDEIGYATPKTVVANANGVAETFGTYSVANGIVTATVTPATASEELQDITELVNTAGTNQVAAVTIGGNSYVIASDAHSTGGGDVTSASIITLSNVTGLTGFGTTAANGTIVTANNSVLNNSKGSLGSSTAITTIPDSGFSSDTFDSAGQATALLATGLTTYSGLAESALLTIINTSGGAPDIGGIAVTQALPSGITSGDSLSVVFAGGNESILNNGLSVVGDSSITVNSGGAIAIISSLTDAGATNTLTTINVANGGSTTEILAINDTALTTIDAHTDAGALVLGTATSALSENNLTIKGSLGGVVIFASGTGDTISVGASTFSTGGFAALAGLDGNTITASGANNTISIFGGDDDNIFATGTGDTITVANSSTVAPTTPDGTETIGGTAGGVHAGISSSLAGGDTVNIGVNVAVPTTSSATGSLEVAGAANVWVGDGSIVNLTAHSSATVYTDGDFVGAGLSATPVDTTINIAAGFAGTLNIDVDQSNSITGLVAGSGTWAGGTAANSFVNVSAATSLQNALDIAAAQAVVLNQQFGGGGHSAANVGGVTVELAHTELTDWFQYGGNTYTVEAINTGSAAAAHSALAATDVVVEVVGLHTGITAGGGAGVHVIFTV